MSELRVLVADDDQTTCLLMQAALVKAGLAVELAHDGEAALAAFERAPTSDAETRLDDAADALQPAIDRAVIEQFRELDPNGSMALAARILGIYADSSGSVFADIEQSMGNGDSALLRRAAHSLKSSSANVGARQLSALFKEFELLGKENRVDEARAQFDALRAEYARAHEGIRALRLEFES